MFCLFALFYTYIKQLQNCNTNITIDSDIIWVEVMYVWSFRFLWSYFLSLASNLYDTKSNGLNLMRMKNLSSGLRRRVLCSEFWLCGLSPSRQLTAVELPLFPPSLPSLNPFLRVFRVSTGEECTCRGALPSLTYRFPGHQLPTPRLWELILCRLGWALVPSCLVIYQSRCCYEGIFENSD